MSSNILAKCQAAAGSATAALLLARLTYWMPRAKRQVRGFIWVAKSGADWCRETGLTPKQYKTAVARLRSLRLIETEQHLFGSKNITHMRLTELGERSLKGPPKKSQEGPPERSQKGPPNTRSYVKELRKGDTGVLSHASSSEGHDKEVETMKPKQPYSVKDVKPKAAEKLHQPDKVSGLESTWKAIVAEVYGGFVPAFTTKQRGQMKHFLKACPPGKAVAVLEHCLRGWLGFAKTAETVAGVKGVPARPSVDFLLKHVGVAVNAYLDKSKPKAPPPKPKPGFVQPIAKSKPVKSGDKASLNDVMSILGGES